MRTSSEAIMNRSKRPAKAQSEVAAAAEVKSERKSAAVLYNL